VQVTNLVRHALRLLSLLCWFTLTVFPNSPLILALALIRNRQDLQERELLLTISVRLKKRVHFVFSKQQQTGNFLGNIFRFSFVTRKIIFRKFESICHQEEKFFQQSGDIGSLPTEEFVILKFSNENNPVLPWINWNVSCFLIRKITREKKWLLTLWNWQNQVCTYDRLSPSLYIQTFQKVTWAMMRSIILYYTSFFLGEKFRPTANERRQKREKPSSSKHNHSLFLVRWQRWTLNQDIDTAQ